MADYEYHEFYDRLRTFNRLIHSPAFSDKVKPGTISKDHTELFNRINNFMSTTKQLESLQKLRASLEQQPEQLAHYQQAVRQAKDAQTVMKPLLLCLQSTVLRYEALCCINILATVNPVLKRAVVQFEFNGSNSIVLLLIQQSIQNSICEEREKLKALELLVIIASNSTTARDYLLENTAILPTVLAILSSDDANSNNNCSPAMKKSALHVLFALLFQHGDSPSSDLQISLLKHIAPALPVLSEVVIANLVPSTQDSNSEQQGETLLTCCMCLTYIASAAETSGAYLQLDPRVLKCMVQFVGSPSNSRLQAAALRFLSHCIRRFFKFRTASNNNANNVSEDQLQLGDQLINALFSVLSPPRGGSNNNNTTIEEVVLEATNVISKIIQAAPMDNIPLVIQRGIISRSCYLLANVSSATHPRIVSALVNQVIGTLLVSTSSLTDNNPLAAVAQVVHYLSKETSLVSTLKSLQRCEQQQQQQDNIQQQIALDAKNILQEYFNNNDNTAASNGHQQQQPAVGGGGILHIRVRGQPQQDDILHLILRMSRTHL
eukprot:GEZU01029358.1.p1 GENE.GEZU01029358.1~~GEZU01029358.1.p1  ORF type:complete len:548 (+),score=173.41 GEZU01029358.1:68-1711(+)